MLTSALVRASVRLSSITTLHKHVSWLQKYHTAHGGDVTARKGQYADMVNKYYDLATSFYEYGE